VNPTLVRKVIYPAYRALRRDRVLPFLAEMRRIERSSPDQIRDLQWRKLSALLDRAARQVPYYRRIFKEVGADPEDFKSPEDLRGLPVLRKGDIRDNLKDLIADGCDTRRLHPDETGGSTGQNLFFYVDTQSANARLANNIRMNEWTGIRVGDRRAYLWGTRFRVRYPERIKAAAKNWVQNRIYVSAYRMDPKTAQKQAVRLIRFKPELILGYPSVLYHWATTVGPALRNRLKPRAIMSSGETLFEWQRAAIQGALEVPTYNHYGCCEFGAVARECVKRDGLHIAADRVFIEAVPLASSTSGEQLCEIVITDLDNYGMPFIRYAIEDLGVVTWEPCECGLTLPRLRALSGRVYDVVRAPNGNFLGGTFWGHILKAGVERFQVVQEKVDEVTISLVPTQEFGEDTKRYVLDKVRNACGDSMKVRFEIRTDLEPTRSGKHRYVISKVPVRD
jgi:phenylacetate-CoA ligase